VAWRRRRRCVDTTCTGQTRSPEETEKKPTTTSATATADNANATSDNANATAAKTTADNATADNATASTSRSTGDQCLKPRWGRVCGFEPVLPFFGYGNKWKAHNVDTRLKKSLCSGRNSCGKYCQCRKERTIRHFNRVDFRLWTCQPQDSEDYIFGTLFQFRDCKKKSKKNTGQ
jgi:hypothetical protein